jgi:hypothetical protein
LPFLISVDGNRNPTTRQLPESASVNRTPAARAKGHQNDLLGALIRLAHRNLSGSADHGM